MRLHALFTLKISATSLMFTIVACAGPQAVGAVIQPGPSSIATHGDAYTIGNQWIAATFRTANAHLGAIHIDDRLHGRSLTLPDAFTLRLKNGPDIRASLMKMSGGPSAQDLPALPASAQLSARIHGKQICTDLVAANPTVRVHWCAILRDGSGYIRQEVTLQAQARAVSISKVRLLDFEDKAAKTAGTVKGSPVVDANLFFAFEHPLAINHVEGGSVIAELSRELPLQPDQSITYSSVIGATPAGQMRRAFLNYLERERAHPYRTFLHYNTWYDLGYGNRFDEAGALDRVDAFGEELTRKRRVVMDSFLFDDGWDDVDSLWRFNSGFPHGSTKVSAAAARYNFDLGIWLSPWGGYDEAKQRRIAAGRKAGFEIVNDGLALSGPRYYPYFEQACLQMIRQYGVNQFKFDGTGNANQVVAGSAFDSDFAAAIHLIERLRQQSPNIFINLTTGTYPSLFWLYYADSIWRGGEDHSFAGQGTWRQRWITYRDGETYKNIVQGGPLFPLNSLMLHGLIYAQHAEHLSTDPGNDFTAEVRSYFGTGTQLQEMYITPALLSAHNWDVLAEAANWSRANAAVLRDTHWLGGDPLQLQVYGWAAWTPVKAILTLRNPSAKPQSFSLNISSAFELPSDAATNYLLKSPWRDEANIAPLVVRARTVRKIELQPFQVLTLEATPARH